MKYPPGCEPVPLNKHVGCRVHGTAIVAGVCLGRGDAVADRTPGEPGTTTAHPARPSLHARGDAVVVAFIALVVDLYPVPEYRFAPPRRWRFDTAFIPQKVAVEFDGGSFTGGHSRGEAYARECEKFNAAVSLGWRVFRATPKMSRDPKFVALVRAAVEV